MKKYFILISLMSTIIIGVSFLGCERDDICAEATPTTPRLIIRFYDINDPDEFKQVRQLEIDGLDEDGEIVDSVEHIVARTNTDSISLPLNFQGEEETISRFIFTKDADFGDDVDEDGEEIETTESNTDTVTIRYTPEFIYVSRACGYKSIFNLDQNDPIDREIDDDIWTSSFLIINETIENENAAQIIIYH